MSNKGGPRQPSRRNFIRAAAASAGAGVGSQGGGGYLAGCVLVVL